MGVFLRVLAAFFMVSWLPAPILTEDKGETDREDGIIGTGIVGPITHLGNIHVNWAAYSVR
ncbi:hypothetical protein [Ruegeria atlantica]|uniref:Uncharacterized protein n=1 Tax=Ruegeria atlantica TaxID=81569 RepID=A0A0N7LP97_9RHOB|nr:hypothetical protein [Ruegeria atlantica]CUH44612.1 hypothetical protein RUM4293_03518 [Ruegeria atlantica]